MLLRSALTLSLVAALLALQVPVTAQARKASRLSQLIQPPSQLFRPFQLVIGEVNQFQVRGPVGHKVMLLYSPSLREGAGPNDLQVPSDSPKLEGEIPDSGVLTLSVEIPDDERLYGQKIYFDGIIYSQPDGSDAKRLSQLNADGRPAQSLALNLVTPAKTSSKPLILPQLPGVDQNLLRNAATISEYAQTDDERRKSLIKQNGKIDRNLDLQRNSFGQGGVGTGAGGF